MKYRIIKSGATQVYFIQRFEKTPWSKTGHWLCLPGSFNADLSAVRQQLARLISGESWSCDEVIEEVEV